MIFSGLLGLQHFFPSFHYLTSYFAKPFIRPSLFSLFCSEMVRSSRKAAESPAPASPARGRSRSRARASSPPPASPAKRGRSRSASRSRAAPKETAAARKSSSARSKKAAAEKEEEEDLPARRPIRTRSRSAARGEESSSTSTSTAAVSADYSDDDSRLRRRSTRVAAQSERLTAQEAAELQAALEASTQAASAGSSSAKKKPVVVMDEFGGPLGCLAIMIVSHFLVFYFYACLHTNNGELILPTAWTLAALKVWALKLVNIIITTASPTMYAVKLYWGFMISQGIMAVTLPGADITGLPIPSEGNKRYKYLCNGVATWWFTILLTYLLHNYTAFKITDIIDNVGPLTTVSVISSNAVAIVVYVYSLVAGKAAKDISGNHFYDFFLGAWLNPRIGNLDLKMFGEVRVSWIMFFYITFSAAYKHYLTYNVVTPNMALIVVAQFLYTNAIMKGEDCIPTTWDIFHERWGWMLIFWNISGVPFVYTVQAVFLSKRTPDYVVYPTWVTVALFVTLFVAYYIWDTTNSQKNRFRLKLTGSYVPRPWAFPQLPWGTLENPEYITTAAGSPLLVDGWYKYARKIHYTVDIIMAATWAASCGFSNFIPWFYVLFFGSFLLFHRVTRDEARCAKKYGKDWEVYCKKVPYRFIPYVY